jgi:recombination protein RecT
MTTAVAKRPGATLRDLLQTKKQAILDVLPRHMNVERMLKLALLSTTKTPQLLECDPKTVLASVMNAARLGLEIGREAHLVPFRNSKRGTYDCQMIPDYRGLIALARRSGAVQAIEARVVYKGERFEVELGTTPKIHHIPTLGEKKNADITAFYAVARLRDSEVPQFEVMTVEQVDDIKHRSKAKDQGPWLTDYAEMGRKTVVKRLVKYLPASPELQEAVELDNRAETGEVGTVLEIDTDDSINASVATKTAEKLDELKDKLGGQQSGEDAGAVDATPEPEPESEPAPVEQAPKRKPKQGELPY